MEVSNVVGLATEPTESFEFFFSMNSVFSPGAAHPEVLRGRCGEVASSN